MSVMTSSATSDEITFQMQETGVRSGGTLPDYSLGLKNPRPLDGPASHVPVSPCQGKGWSAPTAPRARTGSLSRASVHELLPIAQNRLDNLLDAGTLTHHIRLVLR
jgi:hypothetical protein